MNVILLYFNYMPILQFFLFMRVHNNNVQQQYDVGVESEKLIIILGSAYIRILNHLQTWYRKMNPMPVGSVGSGSGLAPMLSHFFSALGLLS